jgi:hypothetical protein
VTERNGPKDWRGLPASLLAAPLLAATRGVLGGRLGFGFRLNREPRIEQCVVGVESAVEDTTHVIRTGLPDIRGGSSH